MIANGAILTYVGQWTTTGLFQTVNDLLSKIGADLAAQGLPIRSSNVNQSLGQIVGAAGWGGSFSVTLQVQVENGLGFNSADDIISIIRGVVYQETNQFPASDSIPYDQEPGGVQTATGQPASASGPSQTQQGCIAGGSSDLTGSFSLGCWFSNLTTSGLSTVGMLVIVAIVGLILISKTERVFT